MDYETQKIYLETKIKSLTDEVTALQAILDNLNNGYSAPLASLQGVLSERDALQAKVDATLTVELLTP